MKIIKHVFTVTVEVVDQSCTDTPEQIGNLITEGFENNWDSRFNGPMEITVTHQKPIDKTPTGPFQVLVPEGAKAGDVITMNRLPSTDFMWEPNYLNEQPKKEF